MPRLTVILRGELPRLVTPLLQPVTAFINILFPDYRHTPIVPRPAATWRDAWRMGGSNVLYCAAYATAYVTQRMGDVPPRMGTEMQTYVCHGIQDGRGNQCSNTDSPTPTTDTHIRR